MVSTTSAMPLSVVGGAGVADLATRLGVERRPVEVDRIADARRLRHGRLVSYALATLVLLVNRWGRWRPCSSLADSATSSPVRRPSALARLLGPAGAARPCATGTRRRRPSKPRYCRDLCGSVDREAEGVVQRKTRTGRVSPLVAALELRVEDLRAALPACAGTPPPLRDTTVTTSSRPADRMSSPITSTVASTTGVTGRSAPRR